MNPLGHNPLLPGTLNPYYGANLGNYNMLT